MKRFFARSTPLYILAALLWLTVLATARPWVVAHRGGTVIGAENRLQTFEKALALGVDAIELDIHQSKDGKLVVIHDHTTDRTFNHPGRVDRMNLNELRGIGVPTLEEALDLIGRRSRLVIEIKHPKDGGRHQGIEKRLIDLLERRDLIANSIVISFDKASLVKLHQLKPELVTGFLFFSPPGSFSQLKQELGITYLGPYFPLATAEFIQRAHRTGLKVNPWTVNQAAAMRQLVESGCDAITTNHPALLQSILKEKVLVP